MLFYVNTLRYNACWVMFRSPKVIVVLLDLIIIGSWLDDIKYLLFVEPGQLCRLMKHYKIFLSISISRYASDIKEVSLDRFQFHSVSVPSREHKDELKLHLWFHPLFAYIDTILLLHVLYESVN